MSVRKKPSGKWEVRWREGTQHYGRTFDRKKDAERFDLELRRRRQLGGLGAISADVPLAEYVEDWWRIHAVPNLSANTRKTYRHIWAAHCLPKLGGYKLRDLSPSVLRRFSADLLSSGVGEPTLHKALTVLQSILTLAVTEERIDSNPVAKIRKPDQSVARNIEPLPPVTIEQIRGLMQPRDATLVSILAYAGLRPGEVLALTWTDIGKRTIRVERSIALGEEKKTKTKGRRTVNLMRPLAQDLSKWRLASGHRDGLIFRRADGRPWQDHDWRNWRRRIWQPAAKQVGLIGSRPYDLRHSFISLLIQEGHTVIEVARQAGHTSETSLRHYAHVFADYDPANRVSAEEQIWRARRKHPGEDDDSKAVVKEGL